MDLVGLAERSTVLAHELVRHGAHFIVVGGTARWLEGDPRPPRDLDVVVTDDQIPDLVRALHALGVEIAEARLARSRTVSLCTAWGPLDVFVVAQPASSPMETLAVADV